MTGLGHLLPSRAIPSDGSLSPDSCRARRVPVTAEMGQQRADEFRQERMGARRQGGVREIPRLRAALGAAVMARRRQADVTRPD